MSEGQAAATSYLTVRRGTAVVDRFGRDVGEVAHVAETLDQLDSALAGLRFG